MVRVRIMVLFVLGIYSLFAEIFFFFDIGECYSLTECQYNSLTLTLKL